MKKEDAEVEMAYYAASDAFRLALDKLVLESAAYTFAIETYAAASSELALAREDIVPARAAYAAAVSIHTLACDAYIAASKEGSAK